MRHTHATLALAAGVDLKLVSERLGHASVAITADIYQQPTKKMAYDAALKIGRFMAGEGA
jgi:integrase